MEYYNLLPAVNLMEKTEKGKISSNFYLLLTLIPYFAANLLNRTLKDEKDGGHRPRD